MNDEHVRPLPTQDISESQDLQATQETRNTDAGSGLHDASCCASDYYSDDLVTINSDGIVEKCRDFPMWEGLTQSEMLERMVGMTRIIAKNRGVSLPSLDKSDIG
jgi:hypothetical protein